MGNPKEIWHARDAWGSHKSYSGLSWLHMIMWDILIMGMNRDTATTLSARLGWSWLRSLTWDPLRLNLDINPL